MMCCGMIWIRMAQLSEDKFTVLSGNHKGEYPRHVRLKSKHQQIVHEPEMFLMGRYTKRFIHIR